MKLINRLFYKLGFVRIEDNKELLTKLLTKSEEVSELKHLLSENLADLESHRIEILQLKSEKQDLQSDLIHQSSKTIKAEKLQKELQRKNNVLLSKQGKWKTKITNLEADKHNLTVQLEHAVTNNKWKEQFDLLIQELEQLGIKESSDISELQAENRKLKKQNSLMAQLQIVHTNLLNYRQYGTTASYLNSIRPYRVIELTPKESNSVKYE